MDRISPLWQRQHRAVNAGIADGRSWERRLCDTFPGLQPQHIGNFVSYEPSFWDRITGEAHNPANSLWASQHNAAESARRAFFATRQQWDP